MRVLIIDAVVHDRDLACRYLATSYKNVGVAGDLKTASAVMARQMPDVIVLDWDVAGAPAFLQRLRREDPSPRPYVVVTSRMSAQDITSAVAAGADDCMRKGYTREELALRVGALERVRLWATKVFGAGSSCVEFSSVDVSRLQAWRLADQSIAKEVGEMMGCCLASQGEGPASDAMSTIAARIPLIIAAEQTEVRLTVRTDEASLPRLAETCLGDMNAPLDALRDMLREFANTGGGNFVRAAGQEGIALTCGLPVDVDSGAQTARKVIAQRTFVVGPEDGSFRIVFEIEVLDRALKRVSVGQLVEGMVLARDLFTDGGALLAPAGTRLTSSQIERMARIVSPRVTFDVAEAA